MHYRHGNKKKKYEKQKIKAKKKQKKNIEIGKTKNTFSSSYNFTHMPSNPKYVCIKGVLKVYN